MISRNLRLGIALSLGLLVPGAAAAQGSSCLYAIDFNSSSTFTSKLYRLNPTNGQIIGAGLPITHNGVGLSSMVDIEFKSDGYLYAVTTFGGSVVADRNRLFKINPITGQAQLIGPLNVGNIGEGDLSFDTAETLYLNTHTSPVQLYTVNLTTGAGTPTGSVPGINRDLSSMGFNGANELWAIDNTISPPASTLLLKLNPAGGAILPPTPQNILTLGGVGGMDWSATQGRFYTADGGSAGTNVVRLLNTSGPSFTTVGTTNIPGGIAGLTVCRTCVTPPSQMVAWYPFDEKVSTTTAEIAPVVAPVLAHNPGTKFGGANGTGGVVSAALHLDGIDDYVEAPHQSWINFGNRSFSIDLWIRVQAGSSGIRVILDKRDNNPTLRGYHLAINGANGEPLIQLADGTGVSNYLSGLALADGQWHFLAVTVDRSLLTPAIRWYLDGVPAGVVSDPSNRPNSLDNTAPLRIGRRSAIFTDPGWLGADLDELELFRRVLTAGEVQSIFAAGRAGKCKTASPSFPEEEEEK